MKYTLEVYNVVGDVYYSEEYPTIREARRRGNKLLAEHPRLVAEIINNKNGNVDYNSNDGEGWRFLF